MKERCFFKNEVVKQKRKEGWLEVKISKSNKNKDDRQGITLMEK